MKTTKLILSLLAFVLLAQLNAQNVGINEDGSSPHSSALLDLKSETKGLLIPRMLEAQRTAIPLPAEGLMVYQTNNDAGFYYYDGAAWSKMGSGAGASYWKANGSSIFNTNGGSVGIGTEEPGAKLEVYNNTFGPDLIVDGTAGGATNVQLRTHNNGPLQTGQFVMSANEFGGAPKLEFNYQDFDGDVSSIGLLAQLKAFSDTTLTVYGDVLSGGRYHGKGARFLNDDEYAGEMVYVGSSTAYYGVHVDINSEHGIGVGTHTTQSGTALEAISEDGNAAYLSAWGEGNALIVGDGNVGIGVDDPDARLVVSGQDGTSSDIVVEGNTRASIGLRITNGDDHSYVQNWIDGDQQGVSIWQQSFSEDPEAGTAISSAAPIVDFGDGHAVNAHGDINVRGEVTNESKTGSANLLPIAYGMVRSNATVANGTGNFTCTWNGTYQRYEIAIEDESYFWLNYITQVTPVTGGRQVTTSSVGGKLLVYLYDQSGNKVQGYFQIVTFKP